MLSEPIQLIIFHWFDHFLPKQKQQQSTFNFISKNHVVSLTTPPAKVSAPSVMAHACNLALERLRQEDHEFQDSLGYIITLSHKKKKRKEKKKEKEELLCYFTHQSSR
jgi:hypothetical protein